MEPRLFQRPCAPFKPPLDLTSKQDRKKVGIEKVEEFICFPVRFNSSEKSTETPLTDSGETKKLHVRAWLLFTRDKQSW